MILRKTNDTNDPFYIYWIIKSLIESKYYPLVHDEHVKSTKSIHRYCLHQHLSKTAVEKTLPNLFIGSFCNAVRQRNTKAF